MSIGNIFPTPSYLFEPVNKEVLPNPIREGAIMDTADSGLPKIVKVFMLLCSTTALCTSVYLAWASLTSSPVAGCGGGNVFDCDSVLHSQFSSVASIPISIPAVLNHLVIISMLILSPMNRRLDGLRIAALGFACMTAALAAVWFVGLQLFWLKHLCQYCLVAHVCGIALAVMFIAYQPVEQKKLIRIAGLACAAIALLMILQLQNDEPLSYEVIEYKETTPGSTQPSTDEATLFESPDFSEPILPEPLPATGEEENRTKDGASFNTSNLYISNLAMRHYLRGGMALQASLSNWSLSPIVFTLLAEEPSAGNEPRQVTILNDIRLKTTAWPIVGGPEAELIFVELFDYTCPHCQQTHLAIEAARKKLGDRLAVIALPVPLDSKCNPTVKATQAMHGQACELSKLAISVWLVDKKQFEEFHDYLFASKPTAAQALVKAKSMVDPSNLDNVLKGPLPSKYISKHVELYKKAGSGTIPKLLFPRSTSSGAVTSADSIIKLVETHLAGKR